MILVFFIFVLMSQSSASFFGELTGALSTVKSSVGTLLADVGHDLKETYDCTVDAVELMIYDKDQISKYYDKCTGTSTEKNIVTTENIDVGKTINIYFTPFISVTPKNDVTNKLDSSVIEKYSLESKNIDQKLDSVEKVLSNETYRVDNMSNHLEHEFGDLAKTVNQELNIIEEDKLDLQKILLEIEKLQWEREMNIDKTKDEIRTVFDEILKKINNSTQNTNFKNEIKAIVGDVETNSSKTILEELEKWKEKEVELLKGINAEEDKKQSTTESNNIPRTFKEVAVKISKGLLTTSIPTKTIATSPKTITQASSAAAKATSTQRPTETTVTSSEPSTKVSTLNTTVISKEAIIKSSNPTNNVTTTESTTLVPIATSTATSKGSSSQSSTSTTITSTIPPTQGSSTAVIPTPSSTKLTTLTSSTTPTITSTELTTQAPTKLTTVTSREQTTEPLIPTTMISTESVTQASSTTTVAIPTEPTTEASSPRTTVTTKKPTTEAPSTTTTETTTEATTTTTRKRKRRKRPKRKHLPTLTTEKPIIKVSTNPPPSDDYGGLIPKDTKAAAEEALNIFNKSMKTKAILDTLFNNL